MTKVKYFNEISGEEIEVEVTDEVARELKAMKREENTKAQQVKRNEVSVDAFCNGESYLIDEFDILDNMIKKEEIKEKYKKQQKRIELLKKAIYLLTDKEREVVSGLFDKRLTQAELSRKFNISRSAVKQRYDNAMCKIKEFIINNE